MQAGGIFGKERNFVVFHWMEKFFLFFAEKSKKTLLKRAIQQKIKYSRCFSLQSVSPYPYFICFLSYIHKNNSKKCSVRA